MTLPTIYGHKNRAPIILPAHAREKIQILCIPAIQTPQQTIQIDIQSIQPARRVSAMHAPAYQRRRESEARRRDAAKRRQGLKCRMLLRSDVEAFFVKAFHNVEGL